MLRRIASLIEPQRFPVPPEADITNRMTAVEMTKHGHDAKECLRYTTEFPSPKPPPLPIRHVLVDIVAAGINPVDFKLRKWPTPDFIIPLPKILGSDFAGIVKQVPPGSPFQVGQRVLGMLPLLGSHYGSYAGICSIDESHLVAAPANVSLLDLSVMPLVSCTVVQAFRPMIKALNENGSGTAGKKCFITCGSGGVGVLAVQYCSRVLGMIVTAACGERNMKLLCSIGATNVIDYTSQSVEDIVVDFDVIFDTLGYIYEEKVMNKTSKMLRKPCLASEDDSWYVRIASSPYGEGRETNGDRGGRSYGVAEFGGDPLRLNIPETRFDRSIAGTFKTVGSKWMGDMAKWLVGKGSSVSRPPRYNFVIVLPEKDAVAEIATHMASGRIKAVIQKTFPLSDAAEAQILLEEGHAYGKISLIVNPDLVEKEESMRSK